MYLCILLYAKKQTKLDRKHMSLSCQEPNKLNLIMRSVFKLSIKLIDGYGTSNTNLYTNNMKHKCFLNQLV